MDLYQSKPAPERHINRIAGIAQYFGSEVQDPAKARVLELACGTGLNLIAQALVFPNSNFVGMDSNADAIEQANRYSAILDLKNITFELSSFSDFNVSDTYDYVIAHGVLSWVAKDVQEQLLALLKQSMDSRGVAYLSYNSLPGCDVRCKLRASVQEKFDANSEVSLLRKYLTEFADGISDFGPAADVKLKREALGLLTQSDALLFHELLSQDCYAFTLEEVQEGAQWHGLHYLTDAKLSLSDSPHVGDGLFVTAAVDQIERKKNLEELWYSPPQVANALSEMPLAFSLARLEATEKSWVSNLRHEFCPLNEFERAVLASLDGQTTQAAILDKYKTDDSSFNQELAQEISACCQRFLDYSLLLS